MKNKYLSAETEKKLKSLKELKNRISNYSAKEAKEHLINTGIYQRNGQLKSVYR